MFLKQLDTVGFKSFAERTKIDFVEGVTAVVGPNGSGKSNIIDAVRWVLGEQSAKSLRGTKMEDVIFQGSDTRHPLNFAEVTLLLNNESNELPIDYKEVSITRRVYRSGDSEFYINKQACRLKDIIDLFMDSGLGKEAFTIIGQGKVEEILSSKAEERRSIFEEAAGVLKYKQRKRQAEFKLLETEDNLHRVEDIIYEIEQQITPLKNQAEIAQRFITKNKQLKKIEISMLITEISEKHHVWQLLLKEIENIKDEEIKLSTHIQTEEVKLTKRKEVINQIDLNLQKIQKQLLIATEALENTEGKRNVLQERLKHLSLNKESLENELKEIKKERAEKLEIIKTEEKKLTQLSKEHESFLIEIKRIKKELQATGIELTNKIENLKGDYIEVLNEQAVKRNELNIGKNRIKEITESHDSELLRQKNKLNEREKYKHDLTRLDNKLIEETTLLENYKNKIKLETHELNKNQLKYEEMRSKLQEAFEKIARLNSRKETLEEMRDSFQGYFFGVKEVLKAAKSNKLSHIYGIVLDLIDVPVKYITAIDTVLGGQAQNIIVQDDVSARSAINWLRAENKGRATFLPIDSINERLIPQSVIKNITTHAGFIGIATNLVKTKEAYQKVINYLMGNIIVAKTLKDANEIATLTNKRYRIVTLDGDVVYPGGSMSGGAKRQNNQSLFTREKDLEELKNKLVEFKQRTEIYKNETKKQLTLVEENKKNIEKMNKSEEKHTLIFNELMESKQQINSKYKELNDYLFIYDMNQEQTEKEKKELVLKIEIINEELELLSNELIEINKKIEILSEKQSKSQANHTKLNSELHKHEIKRAESEERLKHQKETNYRVEGEHQSLIRKEQEIKNKLQNIIDLAKEADTAKNMDQIIKEKEREKEKIVFELSNERKKLTEVDTLFKDSERELGEEIKKRDKIIIKHQEAEVKANRLDVSLETQIAHLQNTYSISFDRAEKEYQKIKNINEAKKEVDFLKEEIKNLGNVNTGSIEEYKRIKERYTFITTQQQDLLEAKKTLYEVISEMDKEMIALFSKTFYQIQKEFSVVFKELFGGGHAELSLSDPNNLLDTGINIVARPPGKKLRSLSLLSGGERSLTAIALLFSILKVRPVPFCILDEVEAALDEANVVRFAKYVKMHSDDMQFIVITHRRGTMEEADALYGVTMQESGVSRLVSVRLEDTKKLIK